MPFLRWEEIETVLLDMDGTLLDLHFDNYFWLEHIPHKLAKKTGNPIDVCRNDMYAKYRKVSGQLEWYCLDYWAQQLDIDIMAAKREITHLISLRPDTLPFLDALRESGRKVVLVTNAHPDGLSLKVEYTQLDQHIDQLISTHTYGVTKESLTLWEKLNGDLQFDKTKTLFVDDNLTILNTAKQYGIKYLLAVENPDSKLAPHTVESFCGVRDYRNLVNDIIQNPLQ